MGGLVINPAFPTSCVCVAFGQGGESRTSAFIKTLSKSSGRRETHFPVFHDRCAVYMRFVRGKPPLEYMYTRVILAGGHPQYLGWSYLQSRGQARLKTDTGRSATWPRSPCRQKRLPSSRARTRWSLTELKGGEAVRQMDFSDWWGGVFPHPSLIRPQQPPLIASPGEPFRYRRQALWPF
jgi:hypothetical protein